MMLPGILLAAVVSPVLHFCMGCNFAESQLADKDFSGTVYVGSNFAGAILERASFRGANLIAANFQGADLRGAAFDAAERDLSGLALIGVDFSQADLRGTKFAGTVLCWYVVDGAQRATKCDTMQGARVAGASFADVQLCADPTDRRTCVPVSAKSLQRYAGSQLSGAMLP